MWSTPYLCSLYCHSYMCIAVHNLLVNCKRLLEKDRSPKEVTGALLRRKGPLYRWGHWYVVRWHNFPKDLSDRLGTQLCLLIPDSILSTLLIYFSIKSFLPSDPLVNFSLYPSLTALVFLCLLWGSCIYSLVHSVKLPCLMWLFGRHGEEPECFLF